MPFSLWNIDWDVTKDEWNTLPWIAKCRPKTVWKITFISIKFNLQYSPKQCDDYLRDFMALISWHIRSCIPSGSFIWRRVTLNSLSFISSNKFKSMPLSLNASLQLSIPSRCNTDSIVSFFMSTGCLNEVERCGSGIWKYYFLSTLKHILGQFKECL